MCRSKWSSSILGHSSYTLTAATYSHVAPELHDEAARRLDEWFDVKGRPDRELD